MKGFTADAGPAPRARPAALKSRVLVVQAASVSAFYDSQRLVYSRAPGEPAAAVAAASRAIAEVLDDIAAWLEGPKAADPVARS